MKTIRWGILGTGGIARQFAEGLALVPAAELAAVGSREHSTAVAFATHYHIPRAHASYQALAADPDIDVVYIATPHVFHMENSLLCLEHGKAILCEKPFTINQKQAQTVFEMAAQKQLFVMEAMWSIFFPAMEKVRQLVTEGAIGQLKLLTADFGFRTAFDPHSRTFSPDLGGGALLDVGIYPLALAQMLLGAPQQIHSLAQMSPTGVDEQAAMLLGYEGGAMALLHTAVRTETEQAATLLGSHGRLKIHAPWWRPSRITLTQPGREPQTFHLPFEGNGYNYEATAVGECLRQGQTEHPLMPWQATLQLQQTMDTIRNQWGLRYPGE